MKISLLINMKMPTIVGIFIFISRENSEHENFSADKYEKSFITSGTDLVLHCPSMSKDTFSQCKTYIFNIGNWYKT